MFVPAQLLSESSTVLFKNTGTSFTDMFSNQPESGGPVKKITLQLISELCIKAVCLYCIYMDPLENKVIHSQEQSYNTVNSNTTSITNTMLVLYKLLQF